MSGQRTYWHLEPKKRAPSAYEIATTNLHYYPKNGFELNVPVKGWYDKFQKSSPFSCNDWELFVDPRQTTYTKYVELQKSQEIYVDTILEFIEISSYDRVLDSRWVSVLDSHLPPLRFLFHGLQMVAAYVGQMAPGGRITIAAAFQAADEMRRIQKIAYRMRQIRRFYPDFGVSSKAKWEDNSLWQPLRKVIEELLVTYDWGEALVALNIGVKPALDDLFMREFADLARRYGDFQLGNIFMSLNDDCQWHQQWGQALIQLVTQDNSALGDIIQSWTTLWRTKILDACQPIVASFQSVCAQK